MSAAQQLQQRSKHSFIVKPISKQADKTVSAAKLAEVALPPGQVRPRWRLVWGAGLLGVGTMLGALMCTDATVAPGQNPSTVGQCSYPRACYLVRAVGPQAGQCDDCSSTAKCRLAFTPTAAGELDQTGIGGVFAPSADRPTPVDAPAVCGQYKATQADVTATCVVPEMVCIAQGPACTGACVHKIAAAPDAGTVDMAGGDVCAASTLIPPQRRPGAAMGSMTYCPLTDDICCPGAAAVDAGVTDGGAVDAARVD